MLLTYELRNIVVLLLSLALRKTYDIIVLNCYSDILKSCDLQFGFKKNRLMAMCKMMVGRGCSTVDQLK